MTDYTPEQLEEMSKKARELVRDTYISADDPMFAAYDRLKQERDELLEMLKADASTLEAQVYRFRRIGESHKELDLAIKETREFIERIDRG